MKKSLLALAVAGAFVAPAAMAEMKIGGEIDVNIESFNNGSETGMQGNNTHSRWWMDSAEDIGGGTSVIAHLEFDMGVNGNHGGNAANLGNGNGINNRDSYIGLKGATWGQVQFGTQEGIFEAVGYNIDPFHGAAGNGGNIVNILGAHPGGGAVCNGDNIGCRRVDQTITYSSPNFNGLTFQVDYTLAGGPVAAGQDKPSEIDYGAAYSGKATDAVGFRVSAAGIQIKNSGLILARGTAETDSGIRLTGGVTFGDFSVDLLWETLKWKDDTTSDELKVNHIWLGGAWMVPTGKVAIGYTMAGKAKVNGADIDNSEAQHFAIGYYHNLSKNSAAYVIYSQITNKDNAMYNMQDGGTAAIGKDPKSIGVGMYYLF